VHERRAARRPRRYEEGALELGAALRMLGSTLGCVRLRCSV
jgi:hypothetical protein